MTTVTVQNLTASSLSVLDITLGAGQSGPLAIDDSRYALSMQQLDALKNKGYISYSTALATNSGLSVLPAATTQDMDLYVDPVHGNDGYAGTFASPLRSVQAALDAIPKLIRHQVTIHLAAGDYYSDPATPQGYYTGVATVVVEGFGFDRLRQLAGLAYLRVQGHTTALFAGKHVSSYTAPASPDPRATVHVTGTPFTAHALKGKFIRFTSGGSGLADVVPGQPLPNTFPITDNTNNSITFVLAVGLYVTPDNTSVFDIIENDSLIHDGPQSNDGSYNNAYGAMLIRTDSLSSSFESPAYPVIIESVHFPVDGANVKGGNALFSHISTNNDLATYYSSVYSWAAGAFAVTYNSYLGGYNSVYAADGGALDINGCYVSSVQGGQTIYLNTGGLLWGLQDTIIENTDSESTSHGIKIQYGSPGFPSGRLNNVQMLVTGGDCVNVEGPGCMVNLFSGGIAGSGGGGWGISSRDGAQVRVSIQCTVTGTKGDLTVDGTTAVTYATLAGMTPASLTNAHEFSRIFE